MTINTFKERPNWPSEDLEHLGRCPICGNSSRNLLYKNLIDRLFSAPGRWKLYQCSSCGTGYLDPRPNKETIGLAYKDYSTHTSAEKKLTNDSLLSRLRNGYLNKKYNYKLPHGNPLGFFLLYLLPPPWRLEWDYYARHLSNPKPGKDKLLDAGCGNGEFLLRARSQGWIAEGIDIDPEAVKYAANAGLKVKCGDIKSEQFAPSSFDVVTTHQVIEHVHDPHAFLSALYAWLKPGGQLWLGTPNIKSKLRHDFGEDWYPLQPPTHLFIFSPESLIKSLELAGFQEIKFLSRGYIETHYHRISSAMRLAGVNFNINLIDSNKKNTMKLHESIYMELLSWMKKQCSSELVITACKPKNNNHQKFKNK